MSMTSFTRLPIRTRADCLLAFLDSMLGTDRNRYTGSPDFSRHRRIDPMAAPSIPDVMLRSPGCATWMHPFSSRLEPDTLPGVISPFAMTPNQRLHANPRDVISECAARGA